MFRKIPAVANGHNYQDPRRRLYLPENGGVLSAVALMTAGWDEVMVQIQASTP
jgi:hypothetical protein